MFRSGSREKPRKKIDFRTLATLCLMLTGLALLAYPTVSNFINERTQSRIVAGYTRAVAELPPEDYTEMKATAEAYNLELAANEDRFVVEKFDEERYQSLLDVSGTGIMCYVEIPKIKVSLPVYHGTDEAVLQVAVGHIRGSSLPIGGPGTHVAISGHRGLPSAQLFTKLNELAVGDVFQLVTMGEVLVYKVDQVEVVLPDEIELLAIEEGRDLCTLVTCTPYGVNSHRLLIRGVRFDKESPLP